MVDLTKAAFFKSGFVQKHDPIERECSYVQHVQAGKYEQALAIIASGYLPDAVIKFPVPEEYLRCIPPQMNELQADKICRLLTTLPEHRMLRWLVGGIHWELRKKIAHNVYTSPALLQQLAGDIFDDVRAAAAGNVNTPTATFAKLATDRSDDVRQAVASNPNTPDDVRKLLQKDAIPWVRKAADSIYHS